MPLVKLELDMSAPGKPISIHPTLVWDEKTVVLVDTGMPGPTHKLREQFEKAGVPLERLNQIVLTHQDIDHIGGLPELLHEAKTAVEVRAHPADKPYIDGVKPLIKLNAERLSAFMQGLSAEERLRFERAFSPSARPNVTRILEDGDQLNVDGGLTVIHTPGHTPGHICLYHRRSKTLIAGDAMIVNGGRLLGPNPAVTPDMNSALRSLRKLASFDIQSVICYHGGWYRENANERIAELASEA
ncbi:MBL fold metallo-hydrolase [Cohnella laeviribosi]|jgi:glyoxylase-like metal-dependent hydrolase (beta-lactamase superfamily II)|uniref:MBL fold metallo-hydrolase n=1 Tax=Cohnella laeviribosi TaxID=380174 RepID=UPI003D2024A2